MKNQPDLLVLLLKQRSQVTNIESEIKLLERLDSLGMKTPKRYKRITFVNRSNAKGSSPVAQNGLVVQKIKGAQDVRLSHKVKIKLASQFYPERFNNSNNQTLKDIK
ncbi:hypothetical protein, partial [Bathymodiolus thermophilus thioautotrophic gill symbiont]|uniref:hypothetical protein n=1 Tax=Bathymodiolus thermophilus thioautotrophic gill symbiont TaxID=2360 RepID=UPI001160CCE4